MKSKKLLLIFLSSFVIVGVLACIGLSSSKYVRFDDGMIDTHGDHSNEEVSFMTSTSIAPLHDTVMIDNSAADEDMTSSSTTLLPAETQTTSINQIEDAQHKNDPVNLTPSSHISAIGEHVENNPLTYTPPSNPKLTKTVFGFMPYWNLATYSSVYQWDKLSIVAYFSLTCGDTGEWLYEDSGWNTWNSATMDSIIATAHANGVKVVPVVKNFDRYSIRRLVDYYDECDADPVNCPRELLMKRILDQVNGKNVDGVNVDFEYFASETYPVDDKLRADFVSFMDELADKVHAARPGSHVSVDSIASAAHWYTAYDIAGFGASSIDAIMVMSYDFYTSGSAYATPVSPLYGNQYWYTVSASMIDMVAAAPRSKIIMGVPYYGLEFPVDGNEWPEKNATRVATGATTTYASVVNPIYDAWHNDGSLHWDDGEKMRWYAYRWSDPNYGPDYWEGYYDDPSSLSAKYDFVNAYNLSGIGIWALGYDYGHNELWDTIFNKFSKAEFVVVFKQDISLAQQQAVHAALGTEVISSHPNGRTVLVRPVSRLTIDVIKDYKRRSEVLGAYLPTSQIAYLSENFDNYIQAQ